MNENLFQIKTCEVCGNENLTSVLNLGLHPLCDDLVPIGDTRKCIEYPIEIMFCKKCLTGHQRFQVPKKELFPSSYHYRSRFTADVINGLQKLVSTCELKFGDLSGKLVLDIGCNDGSLLDFFRQKGSRTIGIEPTDAYQDAEQKGHLIFNKFLSEDIAKQIVTKCGQPDFITFTNVFAHIENLGEVLRSLKCLMSPSTILVIENHYLGSIFDKNQFDTFYHEHPRTYTYTSFVYIAQSLDVSLLAVEFPSRYGGNILAFLGNTPPLNDRNAINLDELREKESHFYEHFTILRENIENWRTSKKEFINQFVKKHGKLRAKAFPGRAAILVKLLDLNEELISAVYEKPGSMKIGYYLPGTRIPILSDDNLFALPDKAQPILNFAWHIPTEIRNYMSEHGYTGPIYDIVSAEDFIG